MQEILLLIIKHPLYEIVTVHSNLGKHKHFPTLKNSYAKKLISNLAIC